LVLHVGLWRAELELDQAYAGLFHAGRSSTGLYDLLLQDKAVDHLTVVNDATDFF